MSDQVTLEGGPFDGAVIPTETRPSSLVIPLEDAPNMVARYRPTRDRTVFRFREYDRIVGALPLPGGSA